MSGIYILETKDGYRVNYSACYENFFGPFSDETCNYLPNGQHIRECFGDSYCLSSKEEAIDLARKINASKIYEMSDGVMFLDNFKNYTFEELING
jgi:hypothetical protein